MANGEHRLQDEEINVGIVVWIDGSHLALLDGVSWSGVGRAEQIAARPFVCVAVDPHRRTTAWTPLTGERNPRRLLIQDDWKSDLWGEGGLYGVTYLTDGANLFEGPAEAFCDACVESRTRPYERCMINEVGMRAIHAEIAGQRGRRQSEITLL